MPNKLEETDELEKIATQNELLEETDKLEETSRLNKPCSLLNKKTPWLGGDGPRWTPLAHGQPIMPAASRNVWGPSLWRVSETPPSVVAESPSPLLSGYKAAGHLRVPPHLTRVPSLILFPPESLIFEQDAWPRT